MTKVLSVTRHTHTLWSHVVTFREYPTEHPNYTRNSLGSAHRKQLSHMGFTCLFLPSTKRSWYSSNFGVRQATSVYWIPNTGMWLVHSNMVSRANNGWTLIDTDEATHFYNDIMVNNTFIPVRSQIYSHDSFCSNIFISNTWSDVSRVIVNHSTST